MNTNESATLTSITPTRPSAWQGPGIALALLFAAIVTVFFETGAAMVAIWSRSDTFAHAFVVPPIALWLVWRRRAALRAITPHAQPLALTAFAVAAVAWLLGEAGGVAALSQAALVALIVFAVPLTLGMQVARTLLFPLAFLFFAVPAGEFMMPALMQGTADFTVLALRASGIPVYREGLRFAIPSGNWSVVEACSGVRYLMASLMVGTLFAYLNYRSMRKRLVFSAVSIAVPIVANWLRAYMIVMIGHLTNNAYGAGVDHLIYGWVFFGVVVMVLFTIGARYADPDLPEGIVTSDAAMTGDRTLHARAAVWWGPGLALVLVSAAAVLARGWSDASSNSPSPALALPSRLESGWIVRDGIEPALQPKFAGAASQAHRIYADGSREVGVFIAYYRGQTEGHKLVTSTNTVVSSSDERWNAIGRSVRDLGSFGRPATVAQWRLRDAHQADGGRNLREATAWEAYWVADRLTGREAEAKALGAWQRLSGGGDDGAAVVLHASAENGEAAERILEAFWRANVDVLVRLLRDARRGS